jgi:hypothetical protein
VVECVVAVFALDSGCVSEVRELGEETVNCCAANVYLTLGISVLSA